MNSLHNLTRNHSMFFKKKTFDIELLSLHIPKTAGTSFRNILKTVYGDKAVVRLDINEDGVTRLDQVIYDSKNIPNAKVIHGHFTYKDIVDRFNWPGGVKKITWLRHPVKRVVSNYFYLDQRLRTILNEEANNLNILSKMERSLIEYARDDINRNRQTRFLAGASPDMFDFVGIQEDFKQEIRAIAKALNWSTVPNVIHHNKTITDRPELSLDVLMEIEELNREDMDLYKEVLKMRGKNIRDYA